MLFKNSILPALLLCASSVLAANNGELHVTTYGGQHCNGQNQGTTDIDTDTTGVIKMSNAKSISLYAVEINSGIHCNQAQIHYFHEEDCANPKKPFYKKEHVHIAKGNIGKCHKLPANSNHKCAKITCSSSNV